MKSIILLVIAIIAVVAAYSYVSTTEAPAVTDSETIPSSTPTPTPQVAYLNASADNIVVDTPLPGATVPRTFAVSGKARGGWYFEASFPVQVRGENNQILFEGPIQAEGDWMTPEFVPFSTTITIPGAYSGPATLVLHNDNASGLPENDRSISIPVVIH